MVIQMRALVLVLVLLWPTACSARCKFPAFAIGQERNYAIDLSLYVDGVFSQSFRVEQPFRVDYDATIWSGNGLPSSVTNSMRPRAMLEPTMAGFVFEPDVEATFTLSPLGPGPLEPPEDVVLDTMLQDGTRSSAAFELFVSGGTRVPPVTNTPTGFLARLGEWLLRPQQDAWRPILSAIEIDGRRYDLEATGWGWAETVVTFTAPDCLCYGDYNANGVVEQADLDLVLLNWGEAEPAGWPNDVPAIVGQSALDGLLLNWGDRSPPKLMGAGAVPEPSSVVLGLFALCGVLRLKRSRRLAHFCTRG
jgi:hypothetical protein